MLRLGDQTVYLAGDTGFGNGLHFPRAAIASGEIDVAMLSIGAYVLRWFMKEQHMNPEEAFWH
ncbi:hypothetical protein FSB78_18590 [Sphingomonas ginsenosidivorax]|uniref:Uncharacterized protein n=1 Tax=Sphingomonas ginsenosidivorax TaxID=862135 RepID=A0A5C6U5A3_9SPHN|nr:hypothetical protein [Sphingomonas ginsenosidivorax]TXC67989.1 hypothetical protein FSB78_18590 [Sphingomonas ginsenosidivorax]